MTGALIKIGIWLFFVIGWIMNLVKFCQCDFDPDGSWKAEIIHGIGLFVVGGILGWFNFGV